MAQASKTQKIELLRLILAIFLAVRNVCGKYPDVREKITDVRFPDALGLGYMVFGLGTSFWPKTSKPRPQTSKPNTKTP